MKKKQYKLDASFNPEINIRENIQKGQLLGINEQGNEVYSDFDGVVTLKQFDGRSHTFILTVCSTNSSSSAVEKNDAK